MVERLIPASFKEDKKVYKNSILFLRIGMLALFTSFLLTPIFYFIGYLEGCYIMIYAAINVILFVALLYFSENQRLASNYYAFNSLVVFITLICSTGGLSSPFLMWMLTIPPVAVFYLNKRDRIVWSILTGLAVGVMFVCHMMNYEFPQYCPEKWLPAMTMLTYILVLLLFMAIVRSFGASYIRINHKLTKSNSELRQSNKELERFAYIASHDLKSPLRNIVSFTNLFERRYAKTVDDAGREYLQYISESAEQMHFLIEDILEYSRTANRKAKVERVDLNDLIGQISKQLKDSVIYEHAIIELPELPILEADATLLMQLFQNFLENGLKYNEDPQPKITLTHQQKGEHQFFSIKDNGIGIDPKFKDHIFEMFKRLHNKDKYKGTGIGLAICKRIIEDYDGEIWVDSAVGKGTTINFTLALKTLSPSKPPLGFHKPAESLA